MQVAGNNGYNLGLLALLNHVDVSGMIGDHLTTQISIILVYAAAVYFSIILIYAVVLYLFTQQYLRSIILIYAAALIYYSASCEVPASMINIKLSACVYETALIQNTHVMVSSSRHITSMSQKAAVFSTMQP